MPEGPTSTPEFRGQISPATSRPNPTPKLRSHSWMEGGYVDTLSVWARSFPASGLFEG